MVASDALDAREGHQTNDATQEQDGLGLRRTAASAETSASFAFEF
jgi:hypothetical protein